jgi:hypothetical protein
MHSGENFPKRPCHAPGCTPLKKPFEKRKNGFLKAFEILFESFDAKMPIDNNLIENSIRPLAIGRKNYLFAGSHDAAQNAAMIYSFKGTCKLHDVESFAWLKYVLQNMNSTKKSELPKLFPGNYSKGVTG